MRLKRFDFRWSRDFAWDKGIELSLHKKSEAPKLIFNNDIILDIPDEDTFLINLEYYEVHKWNGDYVPEGLGVFDGEPWELFLEYDNVKVHAYGNDFFPPNFRDFLGILHERCCMPYTEVENGTRFSEVMSIVNSTVGENIKITSYKETEYAFIFDNGSGHNVEKIQVIVLKQDCSVISESEYVKRYGDIIVVHKYHLSDYDYIWVEED